MLRWLSLFLLVLVVSFVSGCPSIDGGASDRLEKADSARAGGDHARAADLYEKVCQEYPKSSACKKARDLLPETQATGAAQLLQKEQYRPAKRMAEKAVASSGAHADRARALLKDENLTMGVRYEEALELRETKEALPIMEEVAASKARVAQPAKAWLEKNRPTLLLTLARESCKTKPPKDDCGALTEKLVKLHPKSKEAKEADTLLKSFAKSPFEEAQALDWQGKLVEAATRYDDVCKRSGVSPDLCKQATQRADGARLRAAGAAAAAMKFSEAKGLYEVVSKSTIEANKKQAQTQLDSDAMKSGLVFEEAKTLEVTDKRAALVKMEEAAKSTSAPGWAARKWIDKERPQLYLEDAHAACSKPPGSNDDCPVKSKLLLGAHAGTPQATDARKLLTTWESEPIGLAEKLLKDGNVLGAATEYDRVCARAPDSTSCQKTAPLAIETRMRGAHEAAASGRYIEAKKAFETVALATKDEGKRANIKKTLESPAFVEGLAKETRASSLLAAQTACSELQPNCAALVDDLVKNGQADAEEGKRLLALQAQAKTESASAMAKADDLLSECRALSSASSELQAKCYPEPFAKWSDTGVPSNAEDSSLDRTALATAYAMGVDGPPAPSRARLGLIALGAIVGAALGIFVQLLRRRQVPIAVLVVTATFTLVMLGLFATHAFDRVTAAYATVGIVDR